MKREDKTVSIHTLGCRVNIAESAAMKQGFIDRGYLLVEFGEPSTIAVINTCTVTDRADSTCRNIIRKANKSSQKVVVVGCFAQMEADKVKSMDGVDLVLGTQEKHKLFDYLDGQEQVVSIEENGEFVGAYTRDSDNRTRAFLKIQDGCNYFCSYCIIPYARGRFRSTSVEKAVENVTHLVSQDFKEVVLTGINIGEYQNEKGEDLAVLISELVKVQGLERLRLSSIEPNLVTDELLAVLLDSKKCMDHFHIPLQAGDDKILTSMNRRYTSQEYLESVERVLAYFPNATIGADVITGFPGEDEESYEKTYTFLKESSVTHFHVFPYSERKGTRASTFAGYVEPKIRKERAKRLIDLGNQKIREFSESFIGKESDVLFERKKKKNLCEGYSSNYLRIQLESDEDLSNQIRRLKITSFENGKLQGVCF